MEELEMFNVKASEAMARTTSKGRLLKWKQNGNYIKTSTMITEKDGNNKDKTVGFWYDSYAEVIVSKIGRMLGFNVVKYRLCRIRILDERIITIGCVSEEYKPEGYTEQSIGSMTPRNDKDKLNKRKWMKKMPISDINNYYQILEQLEPIAKGFKEYFDSMIFLDCLTINDDRNLSNFGILTNKKTGDIIPTPIYDNGAALFSTSLTGEGRCMPKVYRLAQYHPFGWSFDDPLEQLIKVSKEMKDNLKTCEIYFPKIFEEMKEHKLPSSRAQFMQDLLKYRIEFICGLP